MEHFFHKIQGWCSIEQRHFYAKMVDGAKDGVHFVEVGAWLGQSTSFMAVEIENSGKNIKFDVIDTWEGSAEHVNIDCVRKNTLYENFLQNTKPVAHRINPVRGRSVDVASQYKDASLDMVFIDAGHAYEDVLSDIIAWLPKIKVGGVIAGDDFDSVEFPGVIQAVQETLTKFNSTTITGRVWQCRIPEHINEQNHIIKSINVKSDKHLNLNINFDREIEATYILTIDGNAKAEEGLRRCIESCKIVGQPNIKVFYGYDGTDRKIIKTPSHLQNHNYMKWFKLMDQALSITEVACALGHLAIWAECMTLDKPIVILEHDAVMLQKYDTFKFYNAIEYLGHSLEVSRTIPAMGVNSIEALPQAIKNKNIIPTPIIRSLVPNVVNHGYVFPLGFHAYAIDPMMARRLFTKVLSEGLVNPIDAIAEIGEFEVVQTEIYAVDGDNAAENSTIDPSITESKTNNQFKYRKYTYDIPGVSL